MFQVDLETFKRMVADLAKAINAGRPIDEIDAGWHCVSLHYLNFKGSAPSDTPIALSYFKWISKRYSQRTIDEEMRSCLTT